MSDPIPSLRNLIKNSSPAADDPSDIDDDFDDDDGEAGFGMDDDAGVSAAGATKTQAGFNLRQGLKAAGITAADDFADDNEALAALLETLRDLNTKATSVEDSTLQEFLKEREQYQQWREQKKAPQKSQAPAPDSALKTPETNVSGIPEDVDPAVAQAIESGMLTLNDKGFYDPVHPSLQGMADLANKARVQTMRFTQRLVNQPLKTQRELLRHILPELLKEVGQPQMDMTEIQALKTEIEQLKQSLAAKEQEAKGSKVQSWVQTNAAQLFVDGKVGGQLTPYGEKYREFEAYVQQNMPDVSQPEVHDKVVELMKLSGVKPKAKKQNGTTSEGSFVEGAARRREGTTASRSSGQSLTEFAGNSPSANKSPTTVGRRGLPNLSRVIAQRDSLQTD